jgi:3-oxoacyl-[acyl-carrier-protein] synthase II
MQSIRSGQADVIIAVGADASITPLVFAGFCSLRALSSEFNDAPERASRPFDRLRDGFVMGEGAAALVVESWAHAKKRKARVYAELVGYAATSEAYHMVIPQEDGEEIATTMKIGLDSAGIGPDQVDYINAHATSTTIGDAVETKAIRSLFKNRADKISISATKSLIGHTLGAAGAIGAVATTLSIHTGQIHPTANYEEPDPACRLDGSTRAVQERKVRYAILNAFGFGSNNATVVFKKFVA